MNELIDLIKTKLKENKWSHCRLAKEAGLSKLTVHNILIGKHKPSDLTIGSLSRALKINYDRLISLRDRN